MKVSLDSLRPHASPVRKHNRRNLDAIKASLREFGQQKPLVVTPDGEILAGNGTWYAAKELGWTELEIVRSDLTGPRALAYAIADNRTTDLSAWDDALPEILARLQTADEALAIATGFSAGEIEQLVLASTGITRRPEADQVPEPPTAPVSQPGAVYQLGTHRLMCGDSTNVEHVLHLVGKSRVHLLLTDPPYNVAYQGRTADALTIQNDSMPSEAFLEFLRKAFTAADRVLRPGAAFYIWHADSEGLNFRLACRDVAWAVRQTLVWIKQAFVLGRQDYQWQHEPCLYGWKAGAPHNWFGGRKQTTIAQAKLDWHLVRSPDGYCVRLDGASYLIQGQDLTVARTETTLLEFDRPARNGEHPTMKPVSLFGRLLANSTRRGQSVLDLFAGSGTTVMAAEETGRTAYAMELDPAYCDVVRRRWAEFVHGEACDWPAITPAV